MTDFEYFNYLKNLIKFNDTNYENIIVEILKTIISGNAIWIIGNGGSASTAEHFETDLLYIKKSDLEVKIKVSALTSNSSTISAIANDIGFENIFSSQLIRKASSNDLLFVISASGNSQNLIKAVEIAHRAGMRSIGLLGFDGGKLRGLLNECLVIDSEVGRYGPVEDIHLAICHSISEQILKKLT